MSAVTNSCETLYLGELTRLQLHSILGQVNMSCSISRVPHVGRGLRKRSLFNVFMYLYLFQINNDRAPWLEWAPVWLNAESNMLSKSISARTLYWAFTVFFLSFQHVWRTDYILSIADNFAANLHVIWHNRMRRPLTPTADNCGFDSYGGGAHGKDTLRGHPAEALVVYGIEETSAVIKRAHVHFHRTCMVAVIACHRHCPPPQNNNNNNI